ncbi:HAMP domain-containing histidine kinase [Rhodopirellula sp.]|nr:HAMP domain-containing sensor histidine kinase [Rhodopirellula sp.]MDB4679247.1 HAMP domain-containing histidine kinase [Rhodopirellula sp.]
MLERRSLKAPIALGVVMIVLVVILAAVWILGNVLGATANPDSNVLFWVMLTTGAVLLTAVLAGVIAYLTLTVKAVNLNRRQSNFIDAVTHELKSPIASLKLYLQTMTRRSVSEEQKQDFHKFMLDDVERLDLLINHLLDVARIDQSGDVVDDEEVSLDELLIHCGKASCVRYRLPSDTVQVDSPPIKLLSKLIQLEILFRNLIDNAVKYGGSPPKVLVGVKSLADEKIMVSITDNGTGIPPNQRRKVFGRFIRLGNELERSTPGTGLGLYLVRNVVKSIGGSIQVSDRADGSGTRFEVTLKGVIRPKSENVQENIEDRLTSDQVKTR